MCAFASLPLFAEGSGWKGFFRACLQLFAISPFLYPIHRICQAVKSKEAKAVFSEATEESSAEHKATWGPTEQLGRCTDHCRRQPLTPWHIPGGDQGVIGPTYYTQ